MAVSISINAVRRTVKEYLLISAGLLLYSFAWIGIVMPAKIVGGGVTGLSMLIFYATGGMEGGGMPLGVSVFVINAVLLIIAMMVIGFRFGAKTVYAVVAMSLFMSIMQKFVPPDVLGGLTEDRLLSAILAGAVSGGGIAMCFSQGGSTGGTDIIAMIINRYRSVSYGKVMMACDFFILGGSFFVNNDITMVIYGYVMVAVVGYTLDAILAGNKQSSQVFVISDRNEEIADVVVHRVKRGVTVLDAKGGYTRQDRKVLLIVCRKNETTFLLRVIKEVDPKAFITVGSVMGVYGEGFEMLRK